MLLAGCRFMLLICDCLRQCDGDAEGVSLEADDSDEGVTGPALADWPEIAFGNLLAQLWTKND
jgi:hypothetical protein